MSEIEEVAAWVLDQARADLQRARRDLQQARQPGYGSQDSLCEEAGAKERLADAEAKQAILDLHDEAEPDQNRHGHWEGYGSNERWVRDEPDECPVCREEVPCRTVVLLAWGYRHRKGYQPAWAP